MNGLMKHCQWNNVNQLIHGKRGLHLRYPEHRTPISYASAYLTICWIAATDEGTQV
jgi:hypothetical protein